MSCQQPSQQQQQQQQRKQPSLLRHYHQSHQQLPLQPQQQLPDLSGHFNDPFLSDFTLRLASPDGAELAQFHVHGIVLAGQSGFFKSMLQNWTARGQRSISITVAEDELGAATAMLQAAYAGAVPPDSDPDQLLATMILADRYQLRACVEACKAQLMGRDANTIAWSTALAMLHLPPGLAEADMFAGLAEKAHQRVWESFKSLDDAWTNRQLRTQWLQLPADALQRVLANKQLSAASENVVYIVAASWLATQLKRHASDPHTLARVQATARELLSGMRYCHMTGNFLAAVAAHHGLLAGQQEVAGWLLEAMQWSRALDVQRREMQASAGHLRFLPRVGADAEQPHASSSPPPPPPAGSAFTSYIAFADLQQAIGKYRASGCSEAYYLLTAGHFYNGFTWRLKLTVKPPDSGSPNDMNIHVGLCWSIEVEGEGALPLAEGAMVQVDFDIATWDFVLHEEDPTSSEGPVVIKAGTCWGWDDFMGPEVYADPTDPALWAKFMTEKQQLLLSCHIYSCS